VIFSGVIFTGVIFSGDVFSYIRMLHCLTSHSMVTMAHIAVHDFYSGFEFILLDLVLDLGVLIASPFYKSVFGSIEMMLLDYCFYSRLVCEGRPTTQRIGLCNMQYMCVCVWSIM